MRSRRAVISGLTAVLAGAVLVIGVFALSVYPDGAESVPAPVTESGGAGAEARSEPSAQATAQATASDVGTTVIVRGQPMLRLGRIFTAASSTQPPISAIDVRDALAVVELVNGTEIDLAGSGLTWETRLRTAAGLTVTTSIGGRELSLQFYAHEEDAALVGPDDRMTVRASDGTPAVLVSAGWPGPNGGELRSQVSIDADGAVFVATEPLPTTAVVLWDRGEVLDTSSAIWETDALVDRRLRYTNWCRAVAHRCEVTTTDDAMSPRSHHFPALLSGTLTCRDDGVLQLDGELFRLLMSVEGADRRRLGGCLPPAVTDVSEGDIVMDARYVHLTALTLDGESLSVVATTDGRLLVGPMVPQESELY